MDNAKGATATHKKSKRVADGTCTQVWAWMTNKCRRRMNQGKGYIISKISQKKKRKKKREKAPESERRWEFTSSDEESFPPGA